MPLSKRIFDLIFTAIMGVILAPILLVIAFLVRFFLGKPVFFRHIRPGYKGRPFDLYKFRTMTDESDDKGELLPDENRLTRFGRFLRSTSFDEFPEIINILRGEMSWVGPRPLLIKYLDRYSSEQARRHEVYPGLTGWAQINGRNNVSWEDKFALDVWYVDHWSFWLDMIIVLRTPFKVFRREGINQPGNATANEFLGSENPQSVDQR
ncbi:MAG: sugar transferase [Anaerolineales bacterium]|nr:sugar transferase [Anaerolineales bacterium]